VYDSTMLNMDQIYVSEKELHQMLSMVDKYAGHTQKGINFGPIGSTTEFLQFVGTTQELQQADPAWNERRGIKVLLSQYLQHPLLSRQHSPKYGHSFSK